jgi:BASS family bile acid:Na+ symporter
MQRQGSVRVTAARCRAKVDAERGAPPRRIEGRQRIQNHATWANVGFARQSTVPSTSRLPLKSSAYSVILGRVSWNYAGENIARRPRDSGASFVAAIRFSAMASNDSSTGLSRGGVARLAAALHRFFLPILLAVYALAAVLPGPGAKIREFTIDVPAAGPQHASMLLLAVLLFCAAAAIQWSEVRELLEHPSVLLAGLLTCWFGPALLVVIVGPVLSRVADAATIEGLLVGLALVAAMPVANSSAGWTQNARGNVALSLGLIVLSILLSPLATPNLLKLMGLVLSEDDTQRIEQVVTQFSGWQFILWVILPSLAGAAAAWFAGPQRVSHAKPMLRLVSLVAILVLNYANASLALARIWESELATVVVLAAALAASVSLLGILLAAVQTRLGGLSRSTMIALVFSLSMKHTGLALVLAGAVLKDEPRVMLVILLSTVAQHLAAAAVDWRLSRTSFPTAAN